MFSQKDSPSTVTSDTAVYLRFGSYAYSPEHTVILRFCVQAVSEPCTLDICGLDQGEPVIVDSVQVDEPHIYEVNVTSFLREAADQGRTAEDVVFLIKGSPGFPGLAAVDLMPGLKAEGQVYLDLMLALKPLLRGSIAHPPVLRVSRSNVYDWSILDEAIQDVQEAGMKMELLWFGSDGTNLSADNRIPAYVLYNYQNTVTADGQSVVRKTPAAQWKGGEVYTYYLDKCDLDLREKEKNVLKDLFDHIAELDRRHGCPRTVVGCQVNNETNVPTRLGHRDRSYSHWATIEWERREHSDWLDFYHAIRAEWLSDLAAGVKESDYSVWTRANNPEFVQYGQPFKAHGLVENEILRQFGGTNLDFYGFDMYRYSELGEIGQALLGIYNQGDNLPMIMETDWTVTGSRRGGSQAKILDYGILFTYAANACHNLYDLIGPDGHNFYVAGPNYSIVPGKVVNSAAIQRLSGMGERGLVLTKLVQGTPARAVRAFCPVDGQVTIETKVRLANTLHTWQAPAVLDTEGDQILALCFDQGKIKITSGRCECLAGEYEAETWYELRIILDSGNQACSLEINDQRVLDNLPIPRPFAVVGGVEWFAGSGTLGIMDVSYLRVMCSAAQSGSEAVLDEQFGQLDDGGLASWQLDFRGEYSWVEDVRKTNQMLLKIWHDLATKAADSAGGRNLVFFNQHAAEKATVGKLVNGYLFYYQTENKGVGIAVCRGDHEYVLASKTASRFILPLNFRAESATAGCYDENNQWVAEKEKNYRWENGRQVFDLEPYEVVRLTT